MLKSIKRTIWPSRHNKNHIINLTAKKAAPQNATHSKPKIDSGEEAQSEKIIITCPKCTTRFITEAGLVNEFSGSVNCSVCKWEWTENA